MSRPLAIVTGSSRGIGRAVTSELLDRDFDVLGIARSEPDGCEGNDRYRHLAADLSDPEALATVFDAELAAALALDRRPRVGLVNNAATLDVAGITELGPRRLVQALTLNVAAPVQMYRFVLEHVPAATPLRIVDISSGAATSAYPGWTAYCSSKAALDMAGQVLAAELDESPALAGRNASVCAYAPGVVATSMQDEIRRADQAAFPRRQRFIQLYEDGALVDPRGPAHEIVELLLSESAPRFSRRRYSGN